MTLTIQKNPKTSNDINRLVVFDLQPAKTSQDNFHILSDSRLNQMQKPRNDLTSQEIYDIKEYQSSIEKPKIFSNVKDLLRDLHE